MRTRSPSTPRTTPPTTSTTSASARSRPVSVFGSEPAGPRCSARRARSGARPTSAGRADAGSIPGCRRTAMPKHDTEDERGPEQHEGDEQGRPPGDVTSFTSCLPASTDGETLSMDIREERHQVGHTRPSDRRDRRASRSSATSWSPRWRSHWARWSRTSWSGHSLGRDDLDIARWFADRRTADLERPLGRRLVLRRDGHRPRRPRRRAGRARDPDGTGRSSGSWWSAMAVEGAVYVDRHVLRHPQPARGAAPRGPHRRRQLPVRPHRRGGRAVRLVGDRRVVAHPEPVVAWRSRSRSRSSAPLIVATSRVYRGMHNPTDVICGALHRRRLRRGRLRRRSAPGLADAHERRIERHGRTTTDAPGPGGSLMTSVAVIAHARKMLGGGLTELRGVLADAGVDDPTLVRGAEEQVRAEVRAQGDRRRAPTCSSSGAATAWCNGASTRSATTPVVAGDPPRRHGQPARPQPRHPDRPRAGGRGRAARRAPHDRRGPRQRRAVRGDGRHRARRADDPRRRPRA